MQVPKVHTANAATAIIKNVQGATEAEPVPYAHGKMGKFTVCVVLEKGTVDAARSYLTGMELDPKNLPKGCTGKEKVSVTGYGTLYSGEEGVVVQPAKGSVKANAKGLNAYFQHSAKKSPFKNLAGEADENDEEVETSDDEAESSEDEAEQPPVASALDQADSGDDESGEPTLTGKQSNDLENLIRDLVISSDPSRYLEASQLALLPQYGKPIRQQFLSRMERGEDFDDVFKVFMNNLWPKRHDQNFSRSVLGLETGALKTKWLSLYTKWTSRQVAVLGMILEYQQVADRLLEEKDLPSVTEDGDSWGKLNDVSDTISDWEIEGLLKKATGDRTQGEQAEAIAELLTVLREQQEYLSGSSELQDIDKPEFGLQEGTVTELVTEIKTFVEELEKHEKSLSKKAA